jgi:hypothetical protein
VVRAQVRVPQQSGAVSKASHQSEGAIRGNLRRTIEQPLPQRIGVEDIDVGKQVEGTHAGRPCVMSPNHTMLAP